MAAKRDYYEVIGASKTASADELKAAYRKLALQLHPDRNPGDKAAEEKFKEVNEAYEVLSNPEKRQAYDQFGHAGVGQGGPGGFGGGFQGFGDGAGFGEAFSDFFQGIFGGGGGRRRGAARGPDMKTAYEISLQEAFTGAQASVRVARHAACEKCHGSGAKPGTSTKVCPDCRGEGHMRVSRGFFTLEQTCPKCQGEGRVVEHPCPECRGQGRVRSTETLTVRIPPGVEDGTALRVPGAGEAGERGAPPGDLYVVVRVREDARFGRDGDDLVAVRKISFPMAALGGEVQVPTLDKPVRLHVPAGTQSGTLLRVRGEGMPRLGEAGRGDLLVRLVVDIPSKLTKDQKRLLGELAKTIGEEGVAVDEGLLKKVFGK